MAVSNFYSLFGAVWDMALLWKRVGRPYDTALFDWAGACNLFVLYRTVCMDYHLCAPRGKCSLHSAESVFAQTVCIENQDHAVYNGDIDSAVCAGISRMFCRDDVQFL